MMQSSPLIHAFPTSMNHSLQEPDDPISAKKITLEILAGNIASGKSTWTQKRAEAGWITVENDALLMALHGGSYCWEKQIPSLVNALARQIITAAAHAERSVVLDATNRSRVQRAVWIDLARELGMTTRIVAFPQHPAEVHAARRARANLRGRSTEYWLDVARKMEAEWEPPMSDEADEVLILNDKSPH